MTSNKRIRNLRRKAAESQEWRCFYCHYPMWETDPNTLKERFRVPGRTVLRFRCTAEHLVAQCDGGRDTEENIVAACHFATEAVIRRTAEGCGFLCQLCSIQDRKRSKASCPVKRISSLDAFRDDRRRPFWET